MAIRNVTEAEFELMLDHLQEEAVHAADHWALLRGLDSSVNTYIAELNRTPAFWRLTMNGLYHTVLSYLGRLYDKTPGSLSMPNFLTTIGHCSNFFSEASFRGRLAKNAYLDSLAADLKPLDMATLQTEMSTVTASDPLVRRLHDLRNKFVAHSDANLVRLDALSSVTGFKPEEIELLLKRPIDLLNKYSLAYRASWMSAKITGIDDYERLLEMLRLGNQFRNQSAGGSS
jgi:AbiU2